MITLRSHKNRSRDGERHGFTFFVIGAAVVLLVVFLIGMQVGRVIEKGARHDGSAAVVKLAPHETPDPAREVGAFAEEAKKVAAVPPPPPSPVEEARQTEKSMTFQSTLSKKEAEIVPLVRSSVTDNVARNDAAAPSSPGKGIIVQAGAFKESNAAASLKKKLEKAGYNVRISEEARKDGGRIHKVMLGPFKDKPAARKAVRKLKQEQKIQAFILRGGGG